MPLKFNLYYLSGLYLLLWTSSFVFLGIYYKITEPNNDTNTAYQLLALFVMLLIIAKTVMCLAAVQRYKKSKPFSKTGRVLFIIGFAIMCLVAIGLLLMSVLVIIPEEFMGPANERYTLSDSDILLDISFFVAAICATNLAVFDLILLKVIREKSDEHLLSFESGENDKV